MTPFQLPKLNKPYDFALKCCDFRDVRQDGTVIIIINPTRQTKLLGGVSKVPTSTRSNLADGPIQK